jgi:hypothetical protein
MPSNEGATSGRPQPASRRLDRRAGACEEGAMSPTNEDDPRRARRNQLVGRIMIVVLALLVLAYVIPLFIHR